MEAAEEATQRVALAVVASQLVAMVEAEGGSQGPLLVEGVFCRGCQVQEAAGVPRVPQVAAVWK